MYKRQVLEFFSSLGIPARVDAEGRAYPASNMAASVLDALRLSFAEAGGEEVTGFRVRSLSRELVATAEDGRNATGRCALLATGGLAAPSLGAADAPFVKALGHRSVSYTHLEVYKRQARRRAARSRTCVRWR